MTIEELIRELEKYPKSTKILIHDRREREDFPFDKTDLNYIKDKGKIIIG